MTPGWTNVRNNLAESHNHKPQQWDLWRSWKFYALLAVSLGLWYLLALVIFR